MYANPAFARDQPKSLLQLRKLTTAASRKRLSSDDTSSESSSPSVQQQRTRAVSPSFSMDSPTSFHLRNEVHYLHHPPVPSNLTIARMESSDKHFSASNICNIQQSSDRGKLDLLALAIERDCGWKTNSV